MLSPLPDWPPRQGEIQEFKREAREDLARLNERLDRNVEGRP